MQSALKGRAKAGRNLRCTCTFYNSMGNEPCADNYGPVNVMELRDIFQETEREKAQDYLWNELVLLQSQTFRTVKGLEYTYQIRGNEMFVSRKTKSITKASVDLALEKIIELSGKVAGPKKLKCFGASYLYPIFIEMGLIKNSPFFIERAKIR